MVVKVLLASSLSPYIIFGVPKRKRGHPSTIEGSHKERRSQASTEPTTAFVRKEGVMDVEEAAEFFHPSPATVTALEVMLQATWTFFSQ